MHSISFLPLELPGKDSQGFIEFMVSSDFPFHTGSYWTQEQMEQNVDAGLYSNENDVPYWIELSDLGRVGYVRLEDIQDPTVLFDVRLASAYRGNGLGVKVLRELTNFVFSSLPHVRRFEGETRSDNLAMRKTFVNAGWVKEAVYREAWPTENNHYLDTVAYAVLRSDWENGTTTPVDWSEPF